MLNFHKSVIRNRRDYLSDELEEIRKRIEQLEKYEQETKINKFHFLFSYDKSQHLVSGDRLFCPLSGSSVIVP